MIIACPKCTGPYQLPDDQVAPLVQVQCPHCEYRVILDFAAANDPSLREPEMLLADGFRSADDYHKALADGHKVASYDLPAAPPTPTPAVAARPSAPTTPPVAARPTAAPEQRPQPTPVLETPSQSSLLSGLSLSDKPGSLGAAVQDVAREPEAAPEVKAEPVIEAKPEVKAEPVIEARPEATAEPVIEAKPEPAVEARPESRTPPHTPPVTPTAKEPPTPELRPVEGKPIEPAAESGKRPIEKAPEKVAEKPAEKPPEKPAEPEGRGMGVVLVVFLVIIAVVIAYTYATTGTFDPRRLGSKPAATQPAPSPTQ